MRRVGESPPQGAGKVGDMATTTKRKPATRATATAAVTPRGPSLAVIIPCFNEEGAVRATVQQVRQVLEAAGVRHEIVVVNDGSKDGTLAEAQASGARVIHFENNIGYGHALKAGIAATRSDLVAILDADGTYPADQLPTMIQMAAVNDMVVGDRGAAMSNVPFIRRPAKWMLNGLASTLAQRKINDLNSGLRVFKRPQLEQFISLLPDGFSFTTTITLCMLASNYRVAYHPIVYGQRVGHSKIRASHFLKFLLLVVRLTVYFQPLRVFLPIGAVLFALGIAKAIYDVFLFNLSESAIFGILGGIIIWSLGLLADMIARLHLRPQIQRGEEAGG
jgi:glycosyltransferase involved in cell wall biosynthesis